MKLGEKRVGKAQTSAGMRRVRADSPTRSRLRRGARPQKIKNEELRIKTCRVEQITESMRGQKNKGKTICVSPLS